MQGFNWKYFTFYGGTIVLVLLLFKTVTAYGEKNLKAPPNLSGNYTIKSSALPECLKNKSLNLIIEQSGHYLAGEFTLADPEVPAEKPSVSSPPPVKSDVKPKTIKLNGLFTDSPLILNSSPVSLGDCAGAESPLTVQIQMPAQKSSPSETPSLDGELRWSSEAIAFTAEAIKPSSQETH